MSLGQSRNYLQLLAEYDRYGADIRRLIGSIIGCLARTDLLEDPEAQDRELRQLSRAYPFLELMYSLSPEGRQLLNTAYSPNVSQRRNRVLGEGSDRSHRPYFTAAQANASPITVTDPYLSSATRLPALSAVYRFDDDAGGPLGYLVLNISLHKLISYLQGDQLRARFHPMFQSVYSVIGGSLLLIAGVLLWAAISDLWGILTTQRDIVTESFGLVVLITLALAIFDLGKTIIEEEVFLDKNLNHHGSTRRTISRFMSAILIAVSIEALLLMFKSLLGDAGQLLNAVWMLLAAVALLVGLGIYLKLSRDG
ncbi:MAG: hypothetical protein LAT62_12070 [Natronospirillum sp.]|uniref:PDC sensor domain-containing protein n=1 Tax=Natronospirillum sp. TaxID=2812955 RepID=UPI00260050DD|nr:hypothetical protein [Natronospirillum sp.]MCH8552668.1 hypothetical protein [Natronospirillum sp.]